jgi:hypothetical protein
MLVLALALLELGCQYLSSPIKLSTLVPQYGTVLTGTDRELRSWKKHVVHRVMACNTIH